MDHTTDTLFHTDRLIGLVGPHMQLFLILIMLSLERSVLKEIVLIVLWQNETWSKYFMLRAGQGSTLTQAAAICCR